MLCARHTADPGVTRTAAVYLSLLGTEPRDRVLTYDRPAAWHSPGRTALWRPGSKAGCGQGKPAGRPPRGLPWGQNPGDLPACMSGSQLLGSRNSISSVGVEATGLQAADSS